MSPAQGPWHCAPGKRDPAARRREKLCPDRNVSLLGRRYHSDWHKIYLQDDWDAFVCDSWKGGQSYMTQAQEVELCAWLGVRFYPSTVEIRTHLAADYALTYSHFGCIKLLTRLGFEYRKSKPLPRVASAQMQTAIIASYERQLRELPANKAVYFADAVHPEYQTKPAFSWGKVESNPMVFSMAGRGHVNIHGAVNLESLNAPFVEPITVDRVSAAQLLTKIKERNPDKRITHVIWDNVAYHKGPDIRAFLAKTACRIHLIHLPPYCRHLNLIERFWAILDQCDIRDRYYPSQKQFADAVIAFMRKTIFQEWTKFRDKVSDSFRIRTQKNFRVLTSSRHSIYLYIRK